MGASRESDEFAAELLRYGYLPAAIDFYHEANLHAHGMWGALFDLSHFVATVDDLPELHVDASIQAAYLKLVEYLYADRNILLGPTSDDALVRSIVAFARFSLRLRTLEWRSRNVAQSCPRLAPLLVHLFTLATAVLRDSTASGSVWGSAKSTGKVDNLRWAGMRTIAFALIQPMCAIVGEPSLT